MIRCKPSCPECHGTGIKEYRAILTIDGESTEWIYASECPIARAREFWIATYPETPSRTEAP